MVPAGDTPAGTPWATPLRQPFVCAHALSKHGPRGTGRRWPRVAGVEDATTPGVLLRTGGHAGQAGETHSSDATQLRPRKLVFTAAARTRREARHGVDSGTRLRRLRARVRELGTTVAARLAEAGPPLPPPPTLVHTASAGAGVGLGAAPPPGERRSAGSGGDRTRLARRSAGLASPPAPAPPPPRLSLSVSVHGLHTGAGAAARGAGMRSISWPLPPMIDWTPSRQQPGAAPSLATSAAPAAGARAAHVALAPRRASAPCSDPGHTTKGNDGDSSDSDNSDGDNDGIHTTGDDYLSAWIRRNVETDAGTPTEAARSSTALHAQLGRAGSLWQQRSSLLASSTC